MIFALLSIVLVLPFLLSLAQQSSALEQDEELWKVVNQLKTTTSFLNTGAHPDDERSHLLAYLSLGEGVRTGSLIANRGEGGQNQIGQELGNGLGIIRSEELIEASAVTNVNLIMLSQDLSDPIYDFGFSKTKEETLNEWGEEITYERLIKSIREYKPEIVFPSFLDVDSEHGHHRTITVLSLKAFDDAADPSIFPEHLEEGLDPWQIKKLYLPAESDDNPTISIEVGNEIDLVYGKTYAQLGEDSRYLHKSQGMGRDLPVAPLYVNLDLIKSVNPIPENETSIYDGLYFNFEDVANRLDGMNNQVRGLLINVQRALDKVIDQYPSRDETLVYALKALEEVKKAIRQVEQSKIDQYLKDDLLFKLKVKVNQLMKVSEVASSLNVVVVVDNPTLTKGGSTSVVVYVENHGGNTLTGLQLDLNIPEDWSFQSNSESINLLPNEATEATFEVYVPEDTEYFHPYKPSIITAQVSYELGKETASYTVEPSETVAILPHVAVELTPDQISINLLDVPEKVEVEMFLTNYVSGPAVAYPSLDLPSGWSATSSAEAVHFDHQGDTETVTFIVTPGEEIPESFEVVGQVEVNGITFATTVQTIDYDHIDTSYYLFGSKALGIALDLAIPDGLKVGYIESGFDQIPDYLLNIGLDITKLSDEEIVEGDLSQYDSIVLGIRAFRRDGLPEQNDRLLNYVEQGGHIVIQYHTPNDSYNGQIHPPYPITIGTPSIRWRVTDKNAEVTIHDSDHALFNYPNQIGSADWANWVQERALYFPSAWDDRYETFISMADPNEDPFSSGILMGEYGKGTYLYTNLVWYRQIQGQVPGGYRIFTNLLSYPLHNN